MKGRLRIFTAAILASLLFVAGPAFGEEEPPPVDPSLALAAEALRANPDLKALESQVEALEKRASASRVWSDPILSVEYSNVPYDSFALDESPMSGVQLTVRQTFPWPGKNARRESAGRAEAEAKDRELDERRLELADSVRRSFWRLALVRQLEALTREDVELTKQFLAAVRARYEVGRAGQQDLLSLEVLRDKLTDDLGDFVREARTVTAAINAALHRDVTTRIETPAETPAPPPPGNLDELVKRALEARPLLKMWKARAEAARLAAERTGYEEMPDVTLWAGWRARENSGAAAGTDFVSLGLSVPIPFDYTDHWEDGKAACLADARAADRGYEAALDGMKSALEDALAAWERAAKKARTYRDELLPRARETVEATLSAYQTDRTDFARLYQTEVQLLDLERAERRARFEAVSMQIRAATLSGGETATEKRETSDELHK